MPFTIYANGIVLYSGPFRSFGEPTTQQCIKDIQDGYFPSELQHRYPDGVPFNVIIFYNFIFFVLFVIPQMFHLRTNLNVPVKIKASLQKIKLLSNINMHHAGMPLNNT